MFNGGINKKGKVNNYLNILPPGNATCLLSHFLLLFYRRNGLNFLWNWHIIIPKSHHDQLPLYRWKENKFLISCTHYICFDRALEEGSEECGGVSRYRGGSIEGGGESVGESSVCSSVESKGGGGEGWSEAWARQKRTSTTIRVDLASPEDVTLDTDSSRVVFSNYGTTVWTNLSREKWSISRPLWCEGYCSI